MGKRKQDSSASATQSDSDLWDAATEHIRRLPGISLADQVNLKNSSADVLLSDLSQSAALARLDLPAAVFDESGKWLVGSQRFPLRIDPNVGRSTWTEYNSVGEFLIFHRVFLEARESIISLLVDAASLQRLLPNTTELTPTEFSVLCGLLNGRTVKAIAKADGVAYNTRRRQMEAVLEKLHVHTQAEAVRLTFVTVIDRLLSALGTSGSSDPGIADLKEHYGSSVRFHKIHLASGSPIRVAEYGDPAGEPVVLFHPLLFPCGVAPAATEELEKSGYRFIVPFRPGFFDTPVTLERTHASALLSDWADSCNALLAFLNVKDVRVISIAFAAPWASEFVRLYPERVKELVFISATQFSDLCKSESKTTSFLHAAAGIVERAPWLSEPIARLHAVGLKNDDRMIRAFQKSMIGSPEDLKEIDRLSTEAGTFTTVVSTSKESIAGIARDLCVMRYPWETYLASLEVPVRFVHGAADRTSPVDDISRLVKPLPSAKLHILANRGHLFSLLDLRDAIEIGKIL